MRFSRSWNLTYWSLNIDIRYVDRISLRHKIWYSRTMATGDSNATAALANAGVDTVVRDGQEYTEVKEGLARILVPFSQKDTTHETLQDAEEQQKVFYNPIQQFNRDLTVLAIKAYGEQVLARPRSFNAGKVAKRKRERTETDGNQPKKHVQESVQEPAEAPSKRDEASDGDPVAMIDVPDAENKPTEDHPVSICTPVTEVPPTASKSHQTVRQPQVETERTTEGCRQDKQHAGPRFTILDALSATGLRALRYAHELPFVTSVTANDLTPSAVEAIKLNAEHNGITSKVNAVQGDARAHMYSLLAEEVTLDHARAKHHRKFKPTQRYDVIDLDPYGTAATFLDAAVNAVRDDGGLLCVTCTDSGVWASVGYAEKAFSLYGGVPVRGFHSHEAGLRLILHAIATSAARYGLVIEPLLSLSIDYYIRIFVRVKKSPAQVKFLAGKTMVVYNCDHGCGAWETQPLLRNKKTMNKSGKGAYYKHGLASGPSLDKNCVHCGSLMHVGGPMYAGPIHSPDFIKRILDDLPQASDEIYGTKPRIEGMLQTALEEFLSPPPRRGDDLPRSNEDELAALEPYPFFFHLGTLSRALHCVCPDDDSFRGALRHLGYEVTRSHCKPGSMKTNAPWSIVWHVMREWVRQKSPVKTDKIKENSTAYALLRLGKKTDAQERATGNRGEDEIDKLEVVFDQKLGRDISKKGLVRYQLNPRENWGPLSKAKGR
ncbi:dimethylguanosine tRNA methyltransferase [Xylariomycetidae sp. FL2044]|nr:dimethylguanosine tRNA methyltransferase [Xylariomycetidae sp. FL2044]